MDLIELWYWLENHSKELEDFKNQDQKILNKLLEEKYKQIKDEEFRNWIEIRFGLLNLRELRSRY